MVKYFGRSAVLNQHIAAEPEREKQRNLFERTARWNEEREVRRESEREKETERWTA